MFPRGRCLSVANPDRIAYVLSVQHCSQDCMHLCGSAASGICFEPCCKTEVSRAYQTPMVTIGIFLILKLSLPCFLWSKLRRFASLPLSCCMS